jgi:transposase
VPGIGKMLSLVWLEEIHRIDRFPSVQDVASYGRLGKGRKESGGQRLGTSGKNLGHAPRKWAFSAAATLFGRHNPQGQQRLARLEKNHDQGKALSILAQTLGRAVDGRLKRQVACEVRVFRQTEGSRAGEPGASRAIQGMSLKRARSLSDLTASLHAKACRGPVSLSPGA